MELAQLQPNFKVFARKIMLITMAVRDAVISWLQINFSMYRILVNIPAINHVLSLLYRDFVVFLIIVRWLFNCRCCSGGVVISQSLSSHGAHEGHRQAELLQTTSDLKYFL